MMTGVRYDAIFFIFFLNSISIFAYIEFPQLAGMPERQRDRFHLLGWMNAGRASQMLYIIFSQRRF